MEPRIKVSRCEDDVIEIEKKPVEKGLIVFYGDSGFTCWQPKYYDNPSLEETLLDKKGNKAALNHGFGGATAEEMLYYYPRLVRPYAPRALVLNTFGNDEAAGYSPFEIDYLTSRILEYAREDFPGIKLYLCNMRPCLVRKPDPPKRCVRFTEYNGLCRDYCLKHPDVRLIDQTGYPGFYEDPAHAGEKEYIREDIFVADKVHFNSAGYAEYLKLFKNVLSDIL
ncbi:MAG: hypothetical protein IJS65_06355 [Clostridia bacterium]|nr:hypothetical protein [Clostridia bacterium]